MKQGRQEALIHASPEACFDAVTDYQTFPDWQAAAETMEHAAQLAELGAQRVVAVDAAAYFSRPGPRLVDGVELLGYLFHPDRVEAPPERRSIEPDPNARTT